MPFPMVLFLMILNGQFTKISMILHVWKPMASNGKKIDTN